MNLLIRSVLLSFILLTPCCLISANAAHSGKVGVLNEKAVLDSAIVKFHSGELRKGLLLIDSLLKAGCSNPYALYLKGECLLLSGKEETLAVIDTLRKLNCHEYAGVLDLKAELFLGDSEFPAKLKEMKEKYPANPEVELSEWLFRLDHGEFEWAKKKVDEVSDKALFRLLPYEAFYFLAVNSDYEAASSVIKRAMDKKLLKMTKTFLQQEALHRLPVSTSEIYEAEIPYAECGPYFGIELEDTSGNKIKASLDTGTSGRYLTIHKKLLGEKIPGGNAVCIKKGIQYRYMSAPSDAFIKAASLKTPSVKDFPVLYFEGGLTSSDGVFSPFAFKGLAVTVDPVNRKFTLRNEAALKKYYSEMSNEFEEIKYIERFGWIFIPCRLQGREVLMMLETGSRDVNFNSLAARKYKIPVVKNATLWNGKEYPVTRPDLTIRIGGIDYKPEDGFVEDFVMGNNIYGLACAGDIGPEFLRNYRFTIDPFEKKIVLERQSR
ncbi:MAG TPA: hypothetical protein VHO43_02760 [Ignavibacteriales bacterium]|nr:hypothetical protein [Ignavibacteriales bacterium]